MVSTGIRARAARRRFPGGHAAAGERGFAMAALLVSLAVMGLLMSMALPVWSQQARREREAELIFRGEQYARAITLYQRRQPGAFPSDLDTLVEQRYLRRHYADPMMADGEFRILRQSDRPAAGSGGISGETASDPASGSASGRTGVASGSRGLLDRDGGRSGVDGGIVGVVSRSTQTSLRAYNGRQRYDQWEFTYDSAASGEDEDDPSPRSGRAALGSGGPFERAGSSSGGLGSVRGEELGSSR